MDADPAVEPELDTFSLILPLPYRIAVIVVLGMSRLMASVQTIHLILIQVFGLGASICTTCLF